MAVEQQAFQPATQTAGSDAEASPQCTYTDNAQTADDSSMQQIALGLGATPRAPTGDHLPTFNVGDDVLPSEDYDMEGLREHLRTHSWSPECRWILDGVLGNPSKLAQPNLIPQSIGPHADRSHYAHWQMFHFKRDENEQGRAAAIWQALAHGQTASGLAREIWGWITIIREPSPILFAALHYTRERVFDMRDVFHSLIEESIRPPRLHAPFADDYRRQRSFVFNLHYFTLIGKDCEPMRWQMCTTESDHRQESIAITRCNSVVALRLHGSEIGSVANPARQKTVDRGPVDNPFSAWQVLQLQCYPDWKASLDTHSSEQRYSSGPKAFLDTLLGEFRDAERRFEDIFRRISERVQPPLEFMFDNDIVMALRFDDDQSTIANHYLWAYGTLNMLTDSIRAMIDAFKESFLAEVWTGEHEIIWPVAKDHPQRERHLSNLEVLRKDFESQMAKLERIIEHMSLRQREILRLREELFSGTSIQEARRMHQQGQNIRLLTLVSIFFLPLSFVTSVFGMTNMPTEKHYWTFGVVLVAICVPFFVVVSFVSNSKRFHRWTLTLLTILLMPLDLCMRLFRGRDGAETGGRDDLFEEHMHPLNSLSREPKSALASLWKNERRRRFSFQEHT